ncbi:MAG: hypothetical protein K9G05_07440 [Candidatus Nanopelagicales bacterium]|nr:hypothetical protein [Candidatus Nanopelagicales bacterium]MCF8551891.1 hypothetical protein [Candidatus Nanopelagicales bacterium]
MEPFQLRVQLDHPGQLFTADDIPPTDPRYTEYTAQPALDTVREELLIKTLPKNQPVELLLELPAEHIHPSTETQLNEAVHRYLQVENKLDQESFASRGPVFRRLLLVSVSVFFGIQMVAITIKNLTNADDYYVTDSISEGLAVTSWVILWVPVQFLTVDAWQRNLRRRRLRTINRMRVRLVASSD